MKYVIINMESGRYVTGTGNKYSYTNRLQEAKTWPTKEAADSEACGNERVRAIEDEIPE